MRVQNLKIANDGWADYEYRTTYRMGWHNLIFVAKTIYPFLINPEVLVLSNMGKSFVPIKIKDEMDLLDIPEGAAIEIRGLNKIYDKAPFQFEIFNQTDIVKMFLPNDYLNSLKKNETEYLDEDGKLHVFDKLMDSIEINSSSGFIAYDTARDIMSAIIQALVMKENFSEERYYKNETACLSINLTKTCQDIVNNWKEIQESESQNSNKTTTAEAFYF